MEKMDEKELYGWLLMICTRMSKNTPFEPKELLSHAFEGYAQASERFNPDNGAKFKTFAEIRVRGAIRDFFRNSTPLKRNVTGAPRPTIISYDHIMDEQEVYPGFYTELCLANSTTPEFTDPKLNALLRAHIEDLNDRDRQIFTDYYWHGLTMKEIGERLGFTESRVSQIHTKVINRIRFKIENGIKPLGGNMGRGLSQEKINQTIDALEASTSLRDAAERIGCAYNVVYFRCHNVPAIKAVAERKNFIGENAQRGGRPKSQQHERYEKKDSGLGVGLNVDEKQSKAASTPDSKVGSEILLWQRLLLEKFPPFDRTWAWEVQVKWFDSFKWMIDEFKTVENPHEPQKEAHRRSRQVIRQRDRG